MAPRARMPRLAAALILAAAARAMSATKKRKQIQKLKELRASEWAHRRADKSAKKTMYYGIPDEWSRRGHIACSREIDRGGDFVVAVASDAPDAVPIFAAINSTAANTRRRRLDVVAFVGAAAAGDLERLVEDHLRRAGATLDLRVSVCRGLDDQLQLRPAMRALQMLGNSTRVKRKELLSPFNFAAFYLPHVLAHAARILYLDTDVVVRGDVDELARMDLGGKPAAAVEDCSQVLRKYIDFPLAEAYRAATARRVGGRACAGDGCEPMPRETPGNATCVFNRGVVLFEGRAWRAQRLAERIERLVVDFVHSKGALFRAGVSQPPFLLALAENYHKLDGAWNVRGLGRDAVGLPEWRAIAASARRAFGGFAGVERDLMRRMAAVARLRDAARAAALARGAATPAGRVANPYARGDHYPYVCPHAASAKILHFNGEVKPWRMARAQVAHPTPAEGALCLWADLGAARRAHRCGTVEACLTSCAGEWHRYVGGLGPLGEP